MIRAIVFDFDGLILDTEGPIYQSWLELYQEHHCHLPFADWVTTIGTMDALFDPFDYLEEQYGRPLDRAAIAPKRLARELSLIETQPVRPGVADYLVVARRLGLKLGVASSSSHRWVSGHLSRLGLLSYFDCLSTQDNVAVTKPDPALYRYALAGLGVRPEQALALEDSPNGILAARRAGMYCVAVPNDLTRHLPLDQADLRLDSLADLPLEDLLARFDGAQP
jgi:HAD superfamily hydrolase (TIGR01509 family)